MNSDETVTKKLDLKSPNEDDGTEKRKDSISLTEESTEKNKDLLSGDKSNSSTISEQILSDGDSVENDRSFQEIEISNILLDNSSLCENVDKCFAKPTDNEESDDKSVYNFINSIVVDILKGSEFKEDLECPEHTSNSCSFNLFDKIDLSDSLVEKHKLDDMDSYQELSENAKLKSDVKGLLMKVKQLEEIVSVKDTALSILTSELESLREVHSNTSSTLNSATSTEYKQINEELQNKVVDFQNALAFRDSIIEQLTESLQNAVNRKDEIQIECQKFLVEIENLKKQLLETSTYLKNGNNGEKKVNEFGTQTDKSNDEVDNKIKLFEKDKDFCKDEEIERKIFEDESTSEKDKIEIESGGLKNLKTEFESESCEIVKIRRELEEKHAKELEELRTYFEKKCVDLEKHFSEEVLSSRKLSNASTSSMNDLNSDVFLSHNELGPSGDASNLTLETRDKNISMINITKKGVEKLKDNLKKMTSELDGVNLDQITKQDLQGLVQKLSQYDLRLLLKFNLVDIQNKYHAELEILREDYENRIDLLNVEHDKKIHDLEVEYREKIKELQQVGTEIQEVSLSSPGDYELAEVVQSYERRLQEQVMLAKVDIFNALEYQIQMLVENSDEDTEWPLELLQLREKFTEKYEKKIAEMSEAHAQEIAKLKEDHLKNLNRTIKRRSLSENELKIVQERDNLRKCTSVLQTVVSHLMKYFSKCEDELNNTLVEEILKQNLIKDPNESTTDFMSTSFSKRVHLMPKVAEMLAAMDESLLPDDLNVDEFSMDLEKELADCLEKLRDDANDILRLTANFQNSGSGCADDVDERIASLTKKLAGESRNKCALVEKLKQTEEYARSLERERMVLDEQLEHILAKQRVLENDLDNAKEKIAQMIDKEFVSEGFGERGDCFVSTVGEEIASFSEVQEKARNIISECPENYQVLLQLLEELCRAGDKLKNDLKKEHIDLKQQIETADKKLRATAQFLEDQAAEREQERDEAMREITSLKEALKEREKDKINYERIGKEVEHLENQMREMSKLMEKNEQKTKEIETEKQEAIDKVYVLRDVIKDLECQVETKTKSEEELQELVQHLQQVVRQQDKSNKELHQQLDAIQNVENIRDHVDRLQDEMQDLKRNAELIGKEGLLQHIRTELNDIEVNLEKRTNDLEALHVAISATSCSSPSEDMSVRDQIRPRTETVALEECHVPLQQLARLKEKLLIHSRAEDAAIKRIRDLEMQLEHVKHDLLESQNEKDILQNQASEQLVVISSLQMRLDEQRLRAEQVQKQNNTSLELKIYDLENEVQNLKEIVHSKDKLINHLKNGIEQTKQRLEDREKELLIKMEDTTYVDMQKQIDQLAEENELLKERINCEAKNAQLLPSLVDNIISDKNKDIDMLKGKLNDTQRELQSYLSLNLDKDQLRSLSSLKSSDRALLSFLDPRDAEQLRKAEETHDSIGIDDVPKPEYKRNVNETILLAQNEFESKMSEYEVNISEIERVGRPNVHYTNEGMPLVQPNSTQINKRVTFADTDEYKRDIMAKDKTIKEYEERIKILEDLEKNVDELKGKLENAEKMLEEATNSFENEKKKFEQLQKELECKVIQLDVALTEKDKEIEFLKEDSSRKDDMYVALAKEKRELGKKLSEMENDFVDKYGRKIENLERKIEELDEELTVVRDVNEKQEKDLSNKQQQIESLLRSLEESEKLIEDKDKHIRNIIDEKTSFENNLKQLEMIKNNYEQEISELREELERFKNENVSLTVKNKQLVDSKDPSKDVQNLKYCREIAEKELQLVKSSSEIEDLKYEINHLQHLLKEKEKVIEQISEDSRSLHVNLETIQNKMRENGNVLDLKKRLQQEQHLNKMLKQEIQTLKMSKRNSTGDDVMTVSIEEITGQVQKELDYSAKLDSNILKVLEGGESGTGGDTGDTEYLKNTLARQKMINHKLLEERQLIQEEILKLQSNYEAQKINSNKLESLLEKETRKYDRMQLENAAILEQMRNQLEVALENEKELENVLQDERNKLKETENQLAVLKAHIASISNSDTSKTELTEYKSLPTVESPEVAKLRQQMEALRDENGKLQMDVKAMKKAKNEVNSNLKYMKEILQFKNDEVEKLEEKVMELERENEEAKKKWLDAKTGLEQKTREVENSRMLINELEDEARITKKHIEDLTEKIRASEKSKGNNLVVPEKFLKKMNELKHLIKDQVKDNKRMSETLSKLTDERQRLQLRVEELEGCTDMPFADVAGRANYLFAKYLKSESTRKALIWQKRYLISLLTTYQYSRPVATILPNLGELKGLNNDQKSQGSKRFKIVAISIIALIRMQYLVRRWQSSRRFGAHLPTISRKYDINVLNHVPAKFKVGEPVTLDRFAHSNNYLNQQQFVPENGPKDFRKMRESNNVRDGFQQMSVPLRETVDAWSGNLLPLNHASAPPFGDMVQTHTEFNRNTNNCNNYAPLNSPQLLLTEYLERFDQIQQRLGIAVDENMT